MKTTVKPKEISTNDITKYALKVLHLQGFEVWRNNNLAVKGRKFIGRKGVADIMGFEMKSGKLMACEVKKIGDILSDDQKEFLLKVKDAGAFAFVARQTGHEIVIDDVKTVIG